jgi:hypothetical protein
MERKPQVVHELREIVRKNRKVTFVISAHNEIHNNAVRSKNSPGVTDPEKPEFNPCLRDPVLSAGLEDLIGEQWKPVQVLFAGKRRIVLFFNLVKPEAFGEAPGEWYREI